MSIGHRPRIQRYLYLGDQFSCEGVDTRTSNQEVSGVVAMADLSASLLDDQARAQSLRFEEAVSPGRFRRHSADDMALQENRDRASTWPNARGKIGHSKSMDGLARLVHHVEEVLLHNEEGAPRLIGRTLPEHLTRGASLRTTVFNLVSTMLGSGMLTLPWCFARLGMGGGLLLMILVPVIGERTICWVVDASAALPLGAGAQRTFPPVVEGTLGRRAALLSAATLISLNYGVCVSYCVVIKGLLPYQFDALLQLVGVHLEAPPSRVACLLVVSIICLLPLSAQRTMDQMRYASIASVALVYVFVACVSHATPI